MDDDWRYPYDETGTCKYWVEMPWTNIKDPLNPLEAPCLPTLSSKKQVSKPSIPWNTECLTGIPVQFIILIPSPQDHVYIYIFRSSQVYQYILGTTFGTTPARKYPRRQFTSPSLECSLPRFGNSQPVLERTEVMRFRGCFFVKHRSLFCTLPVDFHQKHPKIVISSTSKWNQKKKQKLELVEYWVLMTQYQTYIVVSVI